MQENAPELHCSLMPTYNGPPTPEYHPHTTAYDLPVMRRSDSQTRVDSTPDDWRESTSKGLGLSIPMSFSTSRNNSPALAVQHSHAMTDSMFPSAALRSRTPPNPYKQQQIWRAQTEIPYGRASLWSDLPVQSTETWHQESTIAPRNISKCYTDSLSSSLSPPYTSHESPFIKQEHPSPYEIDAIRWEEAEHAEVFEDTRLVRPTDLMNHEPSIRSHTPFMTPITPSTALSPAEASTYARSSVSSDYVSVQSYVERPAPRRGATAAGSSPYECHICGNNFKRTSNLSAHMQIHDADREASFVCEYEDCDRRFHRRTDLERHKRSVHIKAKNYECDLCFRRFARKDTLDRHKSHGCPNRVEFKTRPRRRGRGRRERSTSSVSSAAFDHA